MDDPAPERYAAFVRARTRPAPVPLVPELSLRQAAEVTALWRAAEAELEGREATPYWAFPWAGGQALARYVLDRPELVRGKRVFDLATGSGLVALAAARAGAAAVVACDVDPLAAAAVRLNAELNGLEIAFRAGDPLSAPLPGFDVVLAGDVFYERRLAAASAAWLAARAAEGALALVGDPGRTYSVAAGLLERAAYEVPTSLAIEGGSRLRTRVLEVLGSEVPARCASPDGPPLSLP